MTGHVCGNLLLLTGPLVHVEDRVGQPGRAGTDSSLAGTFIHIQSYLFYSLVSLTAPLQHQTSCIWPGCIHALIAFSLFTFFNRERFCQFSKLVAISTVTQKAQGHCKKTKLLGYRWDRTKVYSQLWIHLLTMMMRWARRVRARKYTTRSLLGSLRFLKAGVCRVIVWGEGRGGGGTSRGRSGPGLGGGSPASAGRRRFKSASCGESWTVYTFVCTERFSPFTEDDTQLKPGDPLPSELHWGY